MRLGPAPYGYALSDEVDADGRRLLVPIPEEQEVIQKIKSLRTEGLSFAKIAQRLNAVQTPARWNGTWRVNRICIILHREGMHTMRKNRPHVPSRFDPEAATALAVELRKEGFSLSQIGGAAAEGEADSGVAGSGIRRRWRSCCWVGGK